jgi:hypothetical protein
MTTMAALRIDPDGTLTDLQLPPDFSSTLRTLLNGWSEYAYYGTTRSAVCAVVHENGFHIGLPANIPATRAVETVRQGPLPYRLYGPVVFLGYIPHGEDLMSLPTDMRDLLAHTAGSSTPA